MPSRRETRKSTIRYIPPSGKHLKLPRSGANPCTLLTARQAATALHERSVREVEGPLGPTCIFRSSKGAQLATLALESVNVPKQLHLMRHLTLTKINGIRAYCGTIGAPLLLVPLTRTTTLHIQAPCARAEAMARYAIRHMHT